ncbi:MAG: hypothetical protein MJ250_02325, partial [Alphaproteobacteria bacterium]|nr:hypothetical protein [Alphaproteobacteria bacterium]
MSTNKIALTSSMRSNLLSLKNTQKLFDSTQDKLSTGYKVNSAMDNPSSYFTAQSLNSRADDLNTLLDSIGQAVSTLQVTDQGITSLQDLVSQAKSIANSARDTANVKANTTSKVYFDKDALKSKLVTDSVKGTDDGSVSGEADTMTIRFGDSTSMTGTTNVQEDTLLSGISTEGDMGSVKIDGHEYKINTASTSGNNMETAITFAGTDAFKITLNGTTSYTLTDADGNSYEFTGDGSSLKGTNGFTKGITEITATVSEDGKTTYAVTGGTAAKDDAATTTTAHASASTSTINVAAGSTVGQMAKVMENMIGADKVSVSVQDSKLNIATKDTTSVEVTNDATTGEGMASVFGMDKGQTITLEATDTAESLRQKIDALDGVS